MYLDIDFTLAQKLTKIDHTSEVKYEIINLPEDNREKKSM